MASSELRAICSRFRTKLRSALLGLGVSRTVIAALTMALALILLDRWWRFGVLGRWAACLGLLVAAAAAFIFWLLRPLEERWSDAHVLSYLDRTLPEGREGLLALAELDDPRQIPEAASEQGRVLIEGAREQLASVVSEVRIDEALERRLPRRWLGVAAAEAAVLAGLFLLTLPHSMTGLGRLLLPWADIPWPQKTQLTLIEPSPPMPEDGWPTPRGEPFRLKIQVGGEVVPRHVELAYRGEKGGRWIRENLRVGDEYTCTTTFPEVLENLRFVFRGNDARTEQLKIRVVDRPALTRIVAIYQFPIYSRVPPKRVESGAVSGLEGTRVTLICTANQELEQAELVFRLKPKSGKTSEASTVAATLDETRRTFKHTFALTTSGSYEVRLKGTTGLAQGQPEVYPIQVVPDEPPVAEILAPVGDQTATPQGRCEVSFQATDDFGLTQVEMRYEINDGESQALSDRVTGPVAQGGKTSRAGFTWDFRVLNVKPGDRLAFYLRARDCNPSGDGVADSPRLRVAFKNLTEFQGHVVLEAKALLTEAKTAYEQQKYAYVDLGHWLAGTLPNPEETLKPREVLSRARSEQDYARRAAQAVAYHTEQLRAHMEANAMRRELMSRRLDQIEKLLHPVLSSLLPGIEGVLAGGEPATAEEAAPDAARAKMQKAARTARPRQRQAALALYRIYAYIADWADLQNVLVKTKRLAEQQMDIHAATVRITPRFKGKEIEDLDEKSVEELSTIGQQQHATYEAERALEEELARLIVKSERERRQGIYVSLMTAFKGLKSHLVNDRMRRAAMAVADNRPHTILDVQQLAIKGLTWVRDGLIAAGDELQPGTPFAQKDIELILKDDRLRPAEAEVAEVAAEDAELTAAAIAEPTDVKPADTLEYALQVWQERQAEALDRTRHIHEMLGRRQRSTRYLRLKMGMLALRGTALETAISEALARGARHECERLPTRLHTLAGESRKAVALTKSGRVGPGVQRVQHGSVESVKDLRRFLEARTQMLNGQKDHEASGHRDPFGRPYVLGGGNLARAAGMLESLGWALLFHRDAMRKAKPIPADIGQEDKSLCRAEVAAAGALLAGMMREVEGAAEAAASFTNGELRERLAQLSEKERAVVTPPDVQRRLTQWARKHLAPIKLPPVPAEPNAASQKELAAPEWRLRQAITALRDLTDERVHTEVEVPEEERIPEATEVAQVKAEDLETTEVMEKVRDELLKYEKPAAVIKRVRESTAIPDTLKQKLIATLEKLERRDKQEEPETPLDAKYRALVTAYFNAIAGHK